MNKVRVSFGASTAAAIACAAALRDGERGSWNPSTASSAGWPTG
ncbi:hypothetical protein [Sinomonas sp. R1AF57]|nr:hypothetical protein [Sinomonas sp. R1AF57]